jgi:transcriptional regulator with XRE-family HTH domain
MKRRLVRPKQVQLETVIKEDRATEATQTKPDPTLPDTVKSDVKDKLHQLRKAAGYTQPELVRRSRGALTLGRVIKLENGQNFGSSHATRAALALAYGVTYEEMVAFLDSTMSVPELLKRRKNRSPRRRHGDLPGWAEAEAQARLIASSGVDPSYFMGARLREVVHEPVGEIAPKHVHAYALIFGLVATPEERAAAADAEAYEKGSYEPPRRSK